MKYHFIGHGCECEQSKKKSKKFSHEYMFYSLWLELFAAKLRICFDMRPKV